MEARLEHRQEGENGRSGTARDCSCPQQHLALAQAYILQTKSKRQATTPLEERQRAPGGRDDDSAAEARRGGGGHVLLRCTARGRAQGTVIAVSVPDPAIQELTLKILPDYREKEKIDGEIQNFYANLGIKRKRIEQPANPTLAQSQTKRSRGPSPNQMIRLEILHLRKYIAKKSGSNVKPEEVEVLCKGVPVGPEYSLEFIRRTIWMDESAKLILEFRRQAT
ncbi:hypothetical protein FI667_g3549, partial [Globisporangium splendens]